jgi:hypothetical protein
MTEPTPLQQRLAHAFEREDALNCGYDHGFASVYGVDPETDGFVDVVLTELKPELDRIDRVRALADQWVKAGPPPLGTPIARWWDGRLVELNVALDEAKDATP